MFGIDPNTSIRRLVFVLERPACVSYQQGSGWCGGLPVDLALGVIGWRISTDTSTRRIASILEPDYSECCPQGSRG